MKFLEKKDDGIVLHLTVGERELIYRALRHYSAYGEDDKYIDEQIGCICEIMNVLHLPRFDKVD
ncbi:MAG: hypothetical protein IKL10_04890 [Clostridia bacterium]|nr:hypothetical protein [Clostridia bacterium]